MHYKAVGIARLCQGVFRTLHMLKVSSAYITSIPKMLCKLQSLKKALSALFRLNKGKMETQSKFAVAPRSVVAWCHAEVKPSLRCLTAANTKNAKDHSRGMHTGIFDIQVAWNGP